MFPLCSLDFIRIAHHSHIGYIRIHRHQRLFGANRATVRCSGRFSTRQVAAPEKPCMGQQPRALMPRHGWEPARTRERKRMGLKWPQGAGACVVLVAAMAAGLAWGHGDVQPQPVDTTGLAPLGDKWLTENPYRGNARAIEIGAHGYTQNCARCHGIEAISGGIAPDLRKLEITPDGDEWYIQLTRKGFTQNGVNKMPAFEGILSQEAMWAIRTWLETRTIAQ